MLKYSEQAFLDQLPQFISTNIDLFCRRFILAANSPTLMKQQKLFLVPAENEIHLDFSHLAKEAEKVDESRIARGFNVNNNDDTLTLLAYVGFFLFFTAAGVGLTLIAPLVGNLVLAACTTATLLLAPVACAFILRIGSYIQNKSKLKLLAIFEKIKFSKAIQVVQASLVLPAVDKVIAATPEPIQNSVTSEQTVYSNSAYPSLFSNQSPTSAAPMNDSPSATINLKHHKT